MGKRVSGALHVAAPREDSESVRIRKISNGYLICRDGVKRGKYFSHEEFSAARPVITAGVAPKPAAKSAPRKSTPRGHIRPGSL